MISAAGTSGEGIGGWCSARIVPCSAGVASTSASQASCSSVTSPWCQPSDAGVEADDPQPGDVVHPVLGLVGGRLVEELLGVRRALVVVAHAPDDLRPDRGREGLDQLAQRAVGLGLTDVGEVAGEDERLRRRIDPREPVEGALEAGHRVDRAVLARLAGEEMGVAHVGDDVTGRGELAERDHDVERTARPQPSAPGPSSGSSMWKLRPTRVSRRTRRTQNNTRRQARPRTTARMPMTVSPLWSPVKPRAVSATPAGTSTAAATATPVRTERVSHSRAGSILPVTSPRVIRPPPVPGAE